VHYEHHDWYSERLGRHMGIEVFGHYGMPMLVFPTSAGDEYEYAGMGMIPHLAHHVEAGRVKFYCVRSVNNDSWYNEGAHPRHRSWVQSMYDAYIEREVAPFIQSHCQSPGIAITTTGSSFGAYHAVNTLLKHPHIFRRCLAMSGVYDVRRYMSGDYDDNCYFNNPTDYVPNLHDAWYHERFRECDIRLATGTGDWERPEATYHFSDILRSRGIPHSLDDWGPEGGHDWFYWKHQMDVYIERLF
jgi:esterase/lipase superfamily enzyme